MKRLARWTLNALTAVSLLAVALLPLLVTAEWTSFSGGPTLARLDVGWRRQTWSSCPAPAWVASNATFPLVTIVCWSIPLAVLGTLERRRQALRNRPSWLCRVCSYDLRGNVSGICPECGTPAKGAA